LYVQETSQNITPLTSFLDTKNTSKAFYVPQVDDEDFNARMKENELNPSNLYDINVQKFMDKGYNQHDATHRVSQYAFMGALNIPGQLNASNLLFDENASDETKDIFAQTLKSTFDNMSSHEIGLATSEILSGSKVGGLTHISSRELIKNEVSPIDLTNLDTLSDAGYEKSKESHELFMLGPKKFHYEEVIPETQASNAKTKLSSIESIQKFFEDILDVFKTKESDSKLLDEENKTAGNGIEIFEHLISKLGVFGKEKLEESKKNDMMINQFTKNYKPNILEVKL
jgi:hypothetical protein